jgi:MFS family permease
LLSWGWRAPFLLSGLLVVVGLVVRLSVAESPEFDSLKQQGALRKRPVVEVLRTKPATVLLVALGIVAAGVAFTITTVFSLAYGEIALGLGSRAMLDVLLPASLGILIWIPFFGWLADRVGCRLVFLAGAASLIVLPFAWFALLDTRDYGAMFFGFSLLFVGYSANYATVPAYFSQVFPPAVRFSGMSIGFTVGLIGGNAFAPTIATSLLNATQGWLSIATYMAAAGLISFVAGVFLREPTAKVFSPAVSQQAPLAPNREG